MRTLVITCLWLGWAVSFSVILSIPGRSMRVAFSVPGSAGSAGREPSIVGLVGTAAAAAGVEVSGYSGAGVDAVGFTVDV